MPRQRHFVNFKDPGCTAFATTTVLNFTRVFSSPEIAACMVRTLAEVHTNAGAACFAYVVMPEHVHLVSRLPEERTVSSFMSSLKAVSSSRIRPLLTPCMLERLVVQTGLNRKCLWQRSFRSYPAHPDVFDQKIRYTLANPVRRGLCDEAADYPWSSARGWQEGRWTEEFGLDWDFVLSCLHLYASAREG